MSMIHDITAAGPRNKAPRRKGRGEASGRGKTCGRGHKGAKARAGKYIKRGHEGGQTPIFRRFPKRGFSNAEFTRRFHIVNVSDLERFDNDATVDAVMLIEAGLIPDDRQPVKILGNGTLSKKLTVMAGRFSESARQKITEAGGVVQNAKGEPLAAQPGRADEPKGPEQASESQEQQPAEATEAPSGETPQE